ncbi:phage tail protein I [Falsihalocynthiibacter arcticus]|uniref:phage tail protein I n=1 Tax=Falsihalocynthiibacter arcticus TaxID=1579316 RepID=UPI003002ECD1
MSDFPSLLPSNSSESTRAIEQAMAEPLVGLEAPLRTLWDVDTCPSNILAWLAWSFSVEVWEHEWSDDTKRSTIRAAMEVHRWKGTLRSVKLALISAGLGDARVVENFGADLVNGVPPYEGWTAEDVRDHWAEYRVYLARSITIPQSNQVREILARVAPVRCHLKGLFFTEALHLYNDTITHDGSYTHGVT